MLHEYKTWESKKFITTALKSEFKSVKLSKLKHFTDILNLNYIFSTVAKWKKFSHSNHNLPDKMKATTVSKQSYN